MNRTINKLFFLISIIFLYACSIFSQTLQFPAVAKSSDDFSSAFGPRLLNGSYDFHAAIDILAPEDTDVKPILNGTIKDVVHTLSSVLVEHQYQGLGTFYVMYKHINIVSGLQDGDAVTQSTKIGDVYYPPGHHLDVRYWPGGLTRKLEPLKTRTLEHCFTVFHLDSNQNELYSFTVMEVNANIERHHHHHHTTEVPLRRCTR